MNPNSLVLVFSRILDRSDVQRLAKVDAPGGVNAAGKLSRSDKLQQ